MERMCYQHYQARLLVSMPGCMSYRQIFKRKQRFPIVSNLYFVASLRSLYLTPGLKQCHKKDMSSVGCRYQGAKNTCSLLRVLMVERNK